MICIKKVAIAMTLFTTSLLTSLASYGQSGQNYSFGNGQLDINPGVGFVSVIDDALQNAGYQTTTDAPPLSLTVDYGISRRWSLGAYLGYSKTGVSIDEYYITYKATVAHTLVGMRGLYHFRTHSHFDPYLGLMLAHNSATITAMDGYAKASLTIKGYTGSFIAGCRYHFSDHMGIFLELGYGVTVVNAGLNIRFASQQNEYQYRQPRYR